MALKLIIPNFWRKRNFISFILFPISILYNAISYFIRYLSSLNVYQPKAKIITIGNINMGGAGKTPVVLSIAKILQNNAKKKIIVLTKGYKGNLNGPIIIDHSHSVNDIGDEAMLISQNIQTCVSKDRLAGIKFLEKQGYEIIITDDGLQDTRFDRSLNLMVIDSYFGFGNGFIFPAGPLRETLNSASKRTNSIILIGDGKFKISTKIPIIKASLESKILLQNKKLIAFAGIGNPEKFFRSVRESEGIIVKEFAFADHHLYTNSELEKLITLAQKEQASLITTEKDYVRIPEQFKSNIQTLPVTLAWKDEETLLKTLF